MTEKEAIYILRNAAWLGSDADRQKVEEAVEVAANAIEAQDMTLYTNLPEVSVEEIITSPLLTKKWKSKHRRIEP